MNLKKMITIIVTIPAKHGIIFLIAALDSNGIRIHTFVVSVPCIGVKLVNANASILQANTDWTIFSTIKITIKIIR